MTYGTPVPDVLCVCVMEDLWHGPHGVAMVTTCVAAKLMVQILLTGYLERTELSSTMPSWTWY